MWVLIGFLVFALIFPIGLSVAHLYFLGKKRSHAFCDAAVYGLGTILTAALASVLGFHEWNETVTAGLGSDCAFLSPAHLPSAACFWGIGLLGILFLQYAKKALPPLGQTAAMAVAYLGMGTNLLWMIQLCSFASPLHAWYLLLPLNYLADGTAGLLSGVKHQIQEQKKRQYQGKIFRKLNCFLLRADHWYGAAFLAALPLAALTAMLLCLFGQQPDSLIKSFTETGNWTLSQRTPPPEIVKDDHYLCTVSLRGHSRLVKPLRLGIRKGRTILVNRQLCVANAFEELIQERAPETHGRIRRFYDRHGYPLSRKIRSAWPADLVYLAMKPLEWTFTAALYACDRAPENRIARQYLPGCPKISGEMTGGEDNV